MTGASLESSAFALSWDLSAAFSFEVFRSLGAVSGLSASVLLSGFGDRFLQRVLPSGWPWRQVFWRRTCRGFKHRPLRGRFGSRLFRGRFGSRLFAVGLAAVFFAADLVAAFSAIWRQSSSPAFLRRWLLLGFWFLDLGRHKTFVPFTLPNRGGRELYYQRTQYQCLPPRHRSGGCVCPFLRIRDDPFRNSKSGSIHQFLKPLPVLVCRVVYIILRASSNPLAAPACCRDRTRKPSVPLHQ